MQGGKGGGGVAHSSAHPSTGDTVALGPHFAFVTCTHKRMIVAVVVV